MILRTGKSNFKSDIEYCELKEKKTLNSQYSILNNKFSSGLTLIELLAVILIISLAILLGLPTFNKFSSNVRLKSAARQIDSLLRSAKNFATTKNTTCTVKIHPRDATTPNQIELTYDEGGSTKQADKIWIASPLIEITDVSGGHGSIQPINFSAIGTADAVSIHLIQKGTLINGNPYDADADYAGLSKAERVKCLTITTNNTTGRSKIYHYGRNDPWSPGDL